MRTNGTISYANEVAHGVSFDTDGNPVRRDISWAGPVPCQVSPRTNSSAGRYEDGNFMVFQFSILAERAHFEGDPRDIRRLRIEWEGRNAGEFPVSGVPQLVCNGARVLINV